MKVDDSEDFVCYEAILNYQEMYRIKYRIKEQFDQLLDSTLSNYNCLEYNCDWIRDNIINVESIAPEIKEEIRKIKPNCT